MSPFNREQDVAFAREKAKRTLPVSMLVLLGIIAMYQPLPKRLVAVVPLLVAVVLGVRLLRFLAGRSGRDKLWPAVTLGLVGILLTSLALQVAFYQQVHAYEECSAAALTQQAQGDCERMRENGPLGMGFVID